MKLYPVIVQPGRVSPFHENLFARTIKVVWERSQCSTANTISIGILYLIGIDKV